MLIMDIPLLNHFISLTVFSLMLTIGLTHPFAQLTSLWRQPEVLIRSLLAVVVLVPLVVFLLLWQLDLPPAVATGLALLAAAPGAPLTTKRAQMSGGDPSYTASLQLTLALGAVVITPLTLAILYALFELETERVTWLIVAGQVAQVTFLPVLIGLLVQRFAPKVAEVTGKPLVVFANVLFILLNVSILVALVLAPDLRKMLGVGWLAGAAIVIMVAAALAIGHLLGGPSRVARSSLAIASVARNIGLSLYIATLSDAGQGAIPTIVAYTILGGLLAVPYGVWNKRRMR
jgi:BASS family bile acid:Na+ symporter